MSKNCSVAYKSTRLRDGFASRIGQQNQHNRSREPITRSRMSVRGSFPSLKMGRMVDWESQLERKACYRFEFSSAVIEFHEQPAPLSLFIDGKYRRYTPDFELSMADGSTLIVEVKPYAKLLKNDIRELLGYASVECEYQGKKLVAVTDQELSDPVINANLHFLRPYLGTSLDKNVQRQALLVFKARPALTIAELAAELGHLGDVYSLLAHQILSIDMNKQIRHDLPISLLGEQNHETRFFSYRAAPFFERS